MSKTRFYLIDRETDGADARTKRVDRRTYKSVVRARSRLNLPYRVSTTYRNGVPSKTLFKLPKPAGWLANEHGG